MKRLFVICLCLSFGCFQYTSSWSNFIGFQHLYVHNIRRRDRKYDVARFCVHAQKTAGTVGNLFVVNAGNMSTRFQKHVHFRVFSVIHDAVELKAGNRVQKWRAYQGEQGVYRCV